MTGFNNPIVGGAGALVYPQIMSPNFNINNPSASPNPSWAILKNGLAYFFGVVIAGGGSIVGPNWIINSSGIFIYSGTPALGNLISADANLAGTDAFGNFYPAGKSSLIPASPGPGGTPQLVAQLYQGSVNFGSLQAVELTGGKTGASVIGFSGDGQITLYSGTQSVADNPATLFLASQGNSGTGQPILSIQQPVQLVGFNALPTGPGPYILGSATGVLQGSTQSRLLGQIALVQTDNTDNANANAGTQGLTAAYIIPIADASIGTVYEIEVPFNGVLQASGLAFKPALNGASVVTSLGDGAAAGFLGAGAGVTGWVKLIMRVKTLGVAGTVDYFIEGGIGQNALHAGNSEVLSSQSTGMPFNSTVANTLRVNSVWSAAVAGQTVTGHGSVFTRKGP